MRTRDGVFLILVGALFAVIIISIVILDQRPNTGDTLRISVIKAMVVAPVFIGQEKGFFKANGLDLDVEVMAGSSAALPALLHGDVDVIQSSPNAKTLAAIKEHGGLIIISDMGRGINELVIRKDLWDEGKIRSIEDLKGRTICVTKLGSGSYFMMGKVLGQHGLTMNDLNLEYIDEMDAIAAIQAGSLDGGMINDPYATYAIQTGRAVNPFHNEVVQALGQNGTEISVLITTRKFAEQHPDQLKKFFTGYVESIEFYNKARQGKEPFRTEVMDILFNVTGIEPKVIDKVYWPNIFPDAKPDLQNLQEALSFFNKQGLVDHGYNISTYVDLSYLP
jgi:NitT/TauT family transport system substrate-binding protein